MTIETATPPGFTHLRVVPVSRPGQPGVSFPPARTDEEEEVIRAKAKAQGMIFGPAMFFTRAG